MKWRPDSKHISNQRLRAAGRSCALSLPCAGHTAQPRSPFQARPFPTKPLCPQTKPCWDTAPPRQGRAGGSRAAERGAAVNTDAPSSAWAASLQTLLVRGYDGIFAPVRPVIRARAGISLSRSAPLPTQPPRSKGTTASKQQERSAEPHGKFKLSVLRTSPSQVKLGLAAASRSTRGAAARRPWPQNVCHCSHCARLWKLQQHSDLGVCF